MRVQVPPPALSEQELHALGFALGLLPRLIGSLWRIRSPTGWIGCPCHGRGTYLRL